MDCHLWGKILNSLTFKVKLFAHIVQITVGLLLDDFGSFKTFNYVESQKKRLDINKFIL